MKSYTALRQSPVSLLLSLFVTVWQKISDFIMVIRSTEVTVCLLALYSISAVSSIQAAVVDYYSYFKK